MIEKARIKQRFFAVNKIIGVSGSETEIIRYCRDELQPLADDISICHDGTLIAEFRGIRPGPKLMLDAHVDEIGVSVKYIDPKGFLFYDSFGVHMNSLIGRRILLQGSKGQIFGVVGITPGHILPPAEQNTLPSVSQSYIDVGANSYDEVIEMGIDVGTTGVYESFAVEMHNPDLIVSRSVDNRIGVTYLLELAKDIKDRNFSGTK
jgi:endoglucanase